jgi:hypothetical protein
LISFTATTFSIPYDFFIKVLGKVGLYESTLNPLPFIFDHKQLTIRALVLVCLTTHYKELWDNSWLNDYKCDFWAKDDSRLPETFFSELTPKWNRNCALRSDYSRRQALIEIDVLSSMALELTLEELKTIYRVQFPVMRQYEADTWYDQNGRIVFTNSKGLTGVGFSRSEWNDIKGMTSGTVEKTIMDDTLPGGPTERTITYLAPFDRCDREKDYETVWAEFERRVRNE